MRLLPFCAVVTVTLGVAFTNSFAFAQTQGDDSGPARVFGYQDTRTGVFHPLSPAGAPASPEQISTSQVKGTYKIRITTRLLTPLSAGEQLACGATIDVESLGESDIPIEQKVAGAESIAATGKTAVCTVVLPFDWVLPTAEDNYAAYGSWYVETVDHAVYPKVRRSYRGEISGGMAFPASGETLTYTASHSL